MNSGNFFYPRSTIGTTIAVIEVNNDMYCLPKQIEKFLLNMMKKEAKSNGTVIFCRKIGQKLNVTVPLDFASFFIIFSGNFSIRF